jgi:hypothetical protein
VILPLFGLHVLAVEPAFLGVLLLVPVREHRVLREVGRNVGHRAPAVTLSLDTLAEMLAVGVRHLHLLKLPSINRDWPAEFHKGAAGTRADVHTFLAGRIARRQR